VYKSNNQDIVQPGSFAFNQYEYVPGRDPALAQTAKVTDMRVTDNGPLLTKVVLHCVAPGTKGLVIYYELDNKNGNLTITDSLDKLKVREKEAVHFAFPFNIPVAALNADNGAFPYAPFTDTLAGGNRDFGYIGKWMDWSGADWGLTFVSPQTPIMEWGAMRSEVIGANSSVSQWKTSFSPGQTLFSYALNNYWHTNYKADQEGNVCFSYTLIPHGPKDLVAAYKSAEDIIAPPVVLQSAKRHLESPFITLGNNQAVVNIIVPLSAPGSYWVRVYNPSDKPVHTTISAGTLKVFRSSVHQEKGASISPGGLDLEPFGNADLLLISGQNK
jgi:alpha-mannosidase